MTRTTRIVAGLAAAFVGLLFTFKQGGAGSPVTSPFTVYVPDVTVALNVTRKPRSV